MNKKVVKMNIKKKEPIAPTKQELSVRSDQLQRDRSTTGDRLVDLLEKANRLSEAHIECKEQMRATEIDLVAVGKELRAVHKQEMGAK